MLRLSRHIELDADAVLSPNLCERFELSDLDKIGECVWAGYQRDLRSRFKWERRTNAAMDLALQVQKDKSFPWAGASNVAFPLVTIAAFQFHSRAYPTIISGLDVVKCRVIGEDATGQKTARANRISTHMSWQVLEQDQAWEEQKDRMLINLPIVGTVFTKSRQDAELGYRVDETVLAQDLVIDYWAKSVESCPRKTHRIPLFRNEVYSAVKRGIFRDVLEESWYKNPANPHAYSASQSDADNRKGQEPPQSDDTTPLMTLEQHVDMDLDGDGYAEPYIITIEAGSQKVLRIVTGFDRIEDIQRNAAGEVIFISRLEYFTRYEFLPSPDGGIYGIGFGVLLGPLNESVNSIINQLIDAGTMQVTKGGFLGRGAKIRGGVYTFAPLEWKRVDSTGDDLRKNIVPLEVGEPSQVMFSLLSLLINYTNRVSGTTDPMVGENPGQNTPAENMRTMVEQGSKIYSAVFKRVWRSMKSEFRKGYILNALYMPARVSFGQGQEALREDYLGNPDDVAPAADPNLVSEEMQLRQAMTLDGLSKSSPGYNTEEIQKRILKILKIENPEQVYPGIEKMGAPKDVKLQIAEMKMQVEAGKLEQQKAEFQAEMAVEYGWLQAEMIKLQAEIRNMQESQEGDKMDRQIGFMNAMLGTMKTRSEYLGKQMDVVMKAMEVKREKIKLDAGAVE